MECSLIGIMARPETSYLLSVVIPAFNEELRLGRTLRAITAFARAQDYPVEIIVVDNLSTDRTAGVVGSFSREHDFVRYLTESVPGKGAALRKGFLSARGAYILFSDADLAVPIEHAPLFLSACRNGADVVIGSRALKGSRRYGEPLRRHVAGVFFNALVRGALLRGIRDTQCGFKLFSGRAGREVFETGIINGFGVDVEVLCIARLRGYRILELPVEWYSREGSKIRLFRDAFDMCREVFRIRRNLGKGLYAFQGNPGFSRQAP